jgi:hypothetical protein
MDRCPGRPSTTAAIWKLVIRIAAENLAWGHRQTGPAGRNTGARQLCWGDLHLAGDLGV